MSKLVSLSEASTIAIHSMILIAAHPDGLTVHAIADMTDFSRFHAAKVLQRLAKSNYLTSTRGPNGGFVLRKDPKEINLLEIYECVEGKIEVSDCPMDHEICALGSCFMGNLTQRLTLSMRDYLKSKTIACFLENPIKNN
jgi:Rrf2 family protein